VHSSTQNRTTTLEPAKPNEANSITRRKGHTFRTVSALLVVAAVTTGLLLWQFSRPRYGVYTSQAIGEGHTAFLLSYPSGWFVENNYAPIEEKGVRSMAVIRLRHDPTHGLQEWMDEHLFRENAQDWSGSFVEIGLQRAAYYRKLDLDTETRRLAQPLRMLTRRGGTYSLRKFVCPAGPVLEIEINNGTGNLQIQQDLVLFPIATPGDPQYEVYIQNHTTERLKDRFRQVAADVVSRIRLVKEHGGPSVTTGSTTESP
jgi:hypothetical protein